MPAPPLDIISVRPPELSSLWTSDERSIMVVFDRPFTLDDVSEGLPSTHQICQLVSEHDSSNILTPATVSMSGGHTMNLNFHFGASQTKPTPGSCYNLRCTTQYSMSG